MNKKELVHNIATYLAIAWLFGMLFYFHYIVEPNWYAEYASEYQELALVFGYIAGFYILVALEVGIFLNSYVSSKYQALNVLVAQWCKVDILLKALVAVLSIYGLLEVSPGHPHS